MSRLLRPLGTAKVAVLVVVLASPLRGQSAAVQSATPLHENAYRATLRALATHRIVLLGESHRNVVHHRFLRELVALPELADRVNDIVVEFGNARYQPLLDRYIAGDSVPHDSLRLVWRNTTQLLAWDAPMYEQFYAAVRAANAALPVGKRLRVLAGDPPIDWDRTHAPTDIPRSYGDRDIETLRIIEREVLQRKRKALVLIGGTHIYREEPGASIRQPALERATLGDQLDRLYPGQAYIIESIFGTGPAGVVRPLRSQGIMPGELIDVGRSALRKASSSVMFGNDVTVSRTVNGTRTSVKLGAGDYPPLRRTVDAFLYHGHRSPEQELADPDVYRDDPRYVAEIRRRIAILAQFFGVDIWTDELTDQLGKAGQP